ncbi:hypothetical protein HMPREF9141_0982 [Prevotella multiformis DSM 16608]|uniref:Uncharacterized protein n=2 Tax=Prevotella multiformis TaxID=282402 RepID=F0F5W6_9BACT|nr:hypothetical protein HMPREF9141_0982 [Prevotella multiformis DSM 16608]
MFNQRKPMLFQTTRHTLMMSVTVQHYVNPRNGVHTYIVRWREENQPDTLGDYYVAFRSFASAVDFICTNFDG